MSDRLMDAGGKRSGANGIGDGPNPKRIKTETFAGSSDASG